MKVAWTVFVLLAFAHGELRAATNAPLSSFPPMLEGTNLLKRSANRPELSRRLLVNGVVVKLDPTNRWLEVRTTNGVERVSFATNANVLITGRPLPIKEVLVGDRVGMVARKDTNGHWQLLSLRVAARPPGEGNVKRLDQVTTNAAPTK